MNDNGMTLRSMEQEGKGGEDGYGSGKGPPEAGSCE